MEDPEGDVTAPELVITGSNGGVKGHPGVMVAGGGGIHRRVSEKRFLTAEFW